jgi:hypothetical protein
MNRIFFASAALLIGALAPVNGVGAPVTSRPAAASGPSLTFAEGWWEQEHREQEARERYWRLPRQQQERYNRLEGEQNRRAAQRRKFDDADNRAREEQHRLLGFERH